MIVVAFLDDQIQRIVKQIIKTLQRPKHQRKLFKCIFVLSLQKMVNAEVETEVLTLMKTDVTLTLESVQVFLKEMDIYLESFDLRIFTMLKIDYTFILQTTLLVANTSVLLIQTSKK